MVEMESEHERCRVVQRWVTGGGAMLRARPQHATRTCVRLLMCLLAPRAAPLLV